MPKEFLKMADVFCGEVTTKLVNDECINEMARGHGAGNHHVLQDRAYWLLIDKDHAEYAAHAINSHDELVRLRDELLAALEAHEKFWTIREAELGELSPEAKTVRDNGLATIAAAKEVGR